jgi:hypothetical protein
VYAGREQAAQAEGLALGRRECSALVEHRIVQDLDAALLWGTRFEVDHSSFSSTICQ